MHSRFDKRFLLLVFPLLRTAWPRLQYMTREGIPFTLLILFILSFVLFNRGPKVPYKVKTTFWSMMLWYALFATSNSIFALFSYGQFLEYHQYATIINTLGLFCVFYISLINQKYKELQFLMIVVLCGVIIAGFGAVSSGEITSRQLLLNSRSRDDLASTFRAVDAILAGLGGYGFIYANAACAGLTLLIACSKGIRKSLKIIAWIAFLSMMFIVKKGGLGTAVAVMGLSVVLALMVLTGRSVRTLKVVGVLCCALFLLYALVPQMLSPLSAPLKSIGESMSPGAIQDRFVSAAESLKGDESSYAYQRAQLFVQSMWLFIENPIIGLGAYQQGHAAGDLLGGHSVIMDMLAQQGLIGLILIVMFFVSAFKFFGAVSRIWCHPNWIALPTIYYLCILFAMFSNQLAKSISGLFLTIVFGYLSMLMQTNQAQQNGLRQYERWKV